MSLAVGKCIHILFGKNMWASQLVKKGEDTVLSRSEEGFGSNCTQMPMNGRGAPAATAGSGIKLALKNLRPIFFCVKRENGENPPPGQTGRVCLWWGGILQGTAKCCAPTACSLPRSNYNRIQLSATFTLIGLPQFGSYSCYICLN